MKRTCETPQDALRSFDLSVCQVGVLFHDTVRAIVTPQFVYSLKYGVMLAMVGDLTAQYPAEDQNYPGSGCGLTLDQVYYDHYLGRDHRMLRDHLLCNRAEPIHSCAIAWVWWIGWCRQTMA